MISMKKAVWAICLTLLLFLIGCEQQTAQNTPSPPPNVTATPGQTPETTMGPITGPTAAEPFINLDQVESGISLTTGLPTDKAYTPVAVMINNHPEARPQSGIGVADIVYEQTIEGGCTRFMAIFNDTLLKKVGSVRSSRVPFANIRQEWDTIFCHWGGQGEMNGENAVKKTFNNTNIKQRYDGMNNTKFFFRDTKGSAPHNGFVNVEAVAAELNYTPEVRIIPFNKDKDLSSWESIDTVTINYSHSSYIAKYQWDDNEKAFLRFTGGKAHMEATTKKQVQVKNVIIQEVPHRTLPDSSKHVVTNIIGSGKCYFMRDGKYIEGTWEKASKTERTIYKDANGIEIEFTPGNTWISHVSQQHTITIK